MRKKGILLICWCTYVTAYLCRINFSTAIPKMSAELGVSAEILGIASSVYFVTYAVGQLCNGFLGDRVNPYRFLLIALTATATLNMAISFCHSVVLVTLLWGCNGYFQSMFWSTLLRLLSFHYVSGPAHKNVSTVMSTCSVTGYLLSWTVLGKLLEHQPSQFYFLIPVLPALVLIPCWIWTGKRNPLETMLAQRRAVLSLGESIREVVDCRLHWVSLLCLGIGAIQEGAVFWLPVMFSQTLGLSTTESLLCLMIVPFAKLMGVFVARKILSLFGDRPKRTEVVLLLAVFGTCILMFLLRSVSAYFTVLLIGILILFVNGANWVLISYLPLRYSEKNMVATLVGIFDFSVYIGAAISSPILGFAMAHYGFAAVPGVWLAFTLLCLLLIYTGAGKGLGGFEREAL